MQQHKEAVVITGNLGFIGTNLTEYYIKKGIHVFGVDDLSNYHTAPMNQVRQSKWAKAGYVSLMESSATSSTILYNIPRYYRVSKVFHLASLASPALYKAKPLHTLEANSQGTQNMLAIADLLGATLIFASTSEVYGDPKVNPQPESYEGNVSLLGSRTCYDEGKRFGEALIYAHNQEKKTHHKVARIFNTYGPYMHPLDGRVINQWLYNIAKHIPCEMYGGTQTRSFCYINDLIEGLVRFADLDKYPGPLNLGSNEEITLLSLWKEIGKMYRTVEGLSLGEEDLSVHPMQADDPRQRRPDTTKAEIQLNWRPTTNLQVGLEQTYRWICKEFL